MNCAGPFDYFPQLFPATCQLRTFGFGPEDQPMEVPPEPDGHGAMQLGKPVPPEPRFEAEIKASVQRTFHAAVPLSQEWHAAHQNVFLKPKKTPPEPGDPVPAALDLPLWWRLAQAEPSSSTNERKAKAPRAQRPPFRRLLPDTGFW